MQLGNDNLNYDLNFANDVWQDWKIHFSTLGSVVAESFLVPLFFFHLFLMFYLNKKQLNTYLIEPTTFPAFDSSRALSTLSRANDRSVRGDMINGLLRGITGQYTIHA